MEGDEEEEEGDDDDGEGDNEDEEEVAGTELEEDEATEQDDDDEQGKEATVGEPENKASAIQEPALKKVKKASYAEVVSGQQVRIFACIMRITHIFFSISNRRNGQS